MENKFLDRVSNLIQNKTARQSITAELESHILDKADYYEEIGYSKEIAMQKAIEGMGNPDDTAVPLNALHKNGKSKNIWSVITAVFAVAFCLLCFNVIPIEYLFRYGDASYMIVHSVTFDFLSMLICGVFLGDIRKEQEIKKHLIRYIAFSLFTFWGRVMYITPGFIVFIYTNESAHLYVRTHGPLRTYVWLYTGVCAGLHVRM